MERSDPTYSPSIGYDSSDEAESSGIHDGNLEGREVKNHTGAVSAKRGGLGIEASLGLVAKSILGGLLITGLIFAVMSVALPILAVIPVGLPLVLGSVVFGVTSAVVITVAFQVLIDNIPN